jgi:hypothetical protein
MPLTKFSRALGAKTRRNQIGSRIGQCPALKSFT